MLEEKILNDYKQAMKDKHALKVSVLSFLRAELINTAVNKKKGSLDDAEVVAVIRKQIKGRLDSIEQFKKGARQDLAEKEASEVDILKTYLPQELGAEEINKVIEEAVVECAAVNMKDMGKVMKLVAQKIAGKADGKVISELVRVRLSRPPAA